MTQTTLAQRDVALVDLLDRLLGGGVVVAGEITLAVADVDLVHVSLRALVSSVASAQRELPAVRAVIDLLAITDADAPPVAPVRLIRAGGLGALCAPVSAEPADTDALWRREELVEGLMADRALLPVRFGTRMSDEGEVAAVLAERRDEFVAALQHVRGAVELAVRVQPSGSPGELDAEHAVHGPLRALARDTTIIPGDDLFRAAYLVDRGTTGVFVRTVRRLQERHPGLAVLCTGPWPPYSFANGPRHA